MLRRCMGSPSSPHPIVDQEESPAEKDWFTWRDVFHLVDIICCCAILFPIVWSIKHLREASQTDGKAARNLEKLTLFRQFYVMVVVYIYFTRIVVYLLKSTMPYQYEWVSEAADQMATLAFYVWTAVSFRWGCSTVMLPLKLTPWPPPLPQTFCYESLLAACVF